METQLEERIQLESELESGHGIQQEWNDGRGWERVWARKSVLVMDKTHV